MGFFFFFFFHASLVPAVSSLRAHGAHATLVGGMHDGPFVFLACDSGHLGAPLVGVSFGQRFARLQRGGSRASAPVTSGVRYRFGGTGAPHSFLF
ncbi:hypothetical protein V8C40DRAFT_112227 [Trichoderma camerunense]